MAKKSAKSKGFRKQNVKKPYLSKRDILVTCVVLALLAVGAFFLFRYDDGALKVQDGAVVTEGDNWLIVNGSSVRGRARYFKLGELGEIEGYAREADALLTDANIPSYVFTPSPEDGNVSLTVSTGHSRAEALAGNTLSAVAALDGTEASELQTAELAGHTVPYYLFTTSPVEESDESDGADAPDGSESTGEADASDGTETDAEAVDGLYARSVAGYLDAAHDSCVILRVESRAESLDACLSDEALVSLLEQGVSAVTLEEAE